MMVIKNCNIKVLIVAAGEGRRSGLSYPKTLFKINKTPILIRIIRKINHIDNNPTIVVSPKGRTLVKNCLKKYKIKSEIIIQKKANGMGDAVLHFKKSKYFTSSSKILLLWGDLPFLYKKSINTLISTFLSKNYFFSLITGQSNKPYTYIIRDNLGNISNIIESRKSKINHLKGERDIGVFLFRKELLNFLNKKKKYDYVDNKKEHNFLYIINVLYKNKILLGSSPITSEKEFISFNYRKDII